jgi:hypothetical protein
VLATCLLDPVGMCSIDFVIVISTAGVVVRIYVSVLCADLLAVRHRVPRSNNHNESMRKIKKKIIKTRVLERNELVRVRTTMTILGSIVNIIVKTYTAI